MDAIIFFTKAPIENFSKTRLLTHLKPFECKELQEILIKDIADQLMLFSKGSKSKQILEENEKATNETNTTSKNTATKKEKTNFQIFFEKEAPQKRISQADVFIFYTPIDGLNILQNLLQNIDAKYFLQEGENIFDKMENAFEKIFSLGYERAILIGSDIFDLKAEDFAKAFEILEQKDMVIGETFDDGYYLVGMNSLKRGILAVGTEKVFEESIDNFKKNNLSFGIIDRKLDIDVIDDLKKVYSQLQGEARLKNFLDKIGNSYLY